MGNCLKTQLKGSVDNLELPVYGCISIPMDLTSVTAIQTSILSTNEAHIVEVINASTGATLVEKHSVWTSLPVATWRGFIGQKIIYRIYNKYTNLKLFDLHHYEFTGDLYGSINIDDFKYVSGMIAFRIRNNNKMVKSGDLNSILSSPSASTLQAIEITATNPLSTMSGKFDEFITNLSAETPTLLVPNLTSLILQGHFTLPDGYTTETLRAKYLAAGVTEVTLYKPISR